MKKNGGRFDTAWTRSRHLKSAAAIASSRLKHLVDVVFDSEAIYVRFSNANEKSRI